MLSFYKQQTVFIQIASFKKSQNNNFILIENPKNNNIILGYRYFAYPKERTLDQKTKNKKWNEPDIGVNFICQIMN